MIKMNKSNYLSLSKILLSLSVISLFSACSSDISDLEQWVTTEKGKRVPFRDDLPEVTPYESFTYSASNLRSPFRPSVDKSRAKPTGPGISPDPTRNREHLESFSLDSLRMVGSMNRNNQSSALVQTRDGLIHQVYPGNYLGENDGRVVSITDSLIQIIEIVPDGLEGYVEREAGISLSD